MEVVHLNQKQLAVRWYISKATLKRWCSGRIDPKFLMLGGRVLYRKVDIVAYVESGSQKHKGCKKNRSLALSVKTKI